ncbi:pyridoxal phosphate-dependent aminotransferase family protein [soil metagenome]
MKAPLVLRQKLDERERKGNLRHLRPHRPDLVDFYSNDYLGLARSPLLRERVQQVLLLHPEEGLGATGSRLLSGTSPLALALERRLAAYHRSEAALLFPSGYAANTGFFSAVPQRGDTVFYDEAIHASIKDGIRLSLAKAYSFRHNSPDDLRRKFRLASGSAYVVVEGLYSMDGDLAPLPELSALCLEMGAYLVVDEAHSNGLYGPGGAGLVVEMGLEEEVFARIVTFGKALGSHGAAVLGEQVLVDFLVNFSRPFIYTTALPLPSLLTIGCAYELLPTLTAERAAVHRLAANLKDKLKKMGLPHQDTTSPIQGLYAENPERLKETASFLEERGFGVRPVLSPTVPEGKERLRVILHAFNTEQEVDELILLLENTL